MFAVLLPFRDPCNVTLSDGISAGRGWFPLIPVPIATQSMRKYGQGASPTRLDASGWYQLYFAAVTEANESRAVLQIDRARRAMQERLVELRSAKGADGGELQDLNNALTYLAILLQHVGREGGNLIWG